MVGGVYVQRGNRCSNCVTLTMPSLSGYLMIDLVERERAHTEELTIALTPHATYIRPVSERTS